MSIELIDMAFISENIPYNPNNERSLDLGYLSLTETELLFEFVNNQRVLVIPISDIQNILKKAKNRHTYIKIFSYSGKRYSFELVKKRLGKYTSLKNETIRLYNLLFKYKFKSIAEKSQKKFNIQDSEETNQKDGSKPNYCIQCGEGLRENAIFCHNCGNKIEFLKNCPVIKNKTEMLTINNIKKIKNEDRTERLKKLIEISPLIKLDDLRKYLDVKSSIFYEKIIEWSKNFGFIIDGEYLITNTSSLSQFMKTLNKHLLIKDLLERKKDVDKQKVCDYCNNVIEQDAKICQYCGYKLSEFNINKKI